MKTKKVILFIVEGITDKTSLGGVIDKLVSSNLADEMKMEYAERFSDSYYKTENTFVDFIRDDKFAVKGNYKETWEFIKLNGNSLKRYSNFHLFFE